MTNSRIIFVFFTLNCTIKKVKLTFFLGNEISTLPYEFHFMPLTFLSNILYYVYTLQKIEVIIWKKYTILPKKDFFIFCIYLCCNLFFWFFLCFFPVCRAFERSEQNQAIAEIRDYASSMLGELDLQEQAIFNATRNLYSDRDFTSIYYNSTRSSSSSLFYDMTLLQKRIKLYYQNLEYVQDVLVYLPKFNYVLTQNYIFDSRDSFYSYIKSSAFEGTPDWLETFPLK